MRGRSDKPEQVGSFTVCRYHGDDRQDEGPPGMRKRSPGTGVCLYSTARYVPRGKSSRSRRRCLFFLTASDEFAHAVDFGRDGDAAQHLYNIANPLDRGRRPGWQ